jgi:hypothetical protein
MAFADKYSSVGPLRSDEEANVNLDNAEMEVRFNEEENGEDDRNAPSGADHLAVMYSPCQDLLLAKFYRGLPTLPCVASICFVSFAKV